jgi:hypothetical protein
MTSHSLELRLEPHLESIKKAFEKLGVTDPDTIFKHIKSMKEGYDNLKVLNPEFMAFCFAVVMKDESDTGLKKVFIEYYRVLTLIETQRSNRDDVLLLQLAKSTTEGTKLLMKEGLSDKEIKIMQNAVSGGRTTGYFLEKPILQTIERTRNDKMLESLSPFDEFEKEIRAREALRMSESDMAHWENTLEVIGNRLNDLLSYERYKGYIEKLYDGKKLVPVDFSKTLYRYLKLILVTRGDLSLIQR